MTPAAITDPIDIPTMAPVLNPGNTQNPKTLGRHWVCPQTDKQHELQPD